MLDSNSNINNNALKAQLEFYKDKSESLEDKLKNSEKENFVLAEKNAALKKENSILSLEVSSLEKALNKQINILSIFGELLSFGLKTENLENFFMFTKDALNKYFDISDLSVGIYDGVEDSLNLVYYENKLGNSKMENFIKNDGFWNQVFHLRGPVLKNADELVKYYSSKKDLQGKTVPKSWLAIPLMIRNDEKLGVLRLKHNEKENAYSSSDIQLLTSLAPIIASTLDLKYFEEKLMGLSKKLDLKTSQWNNLIEDLPVGFYITTPEGKVIQVNDKLVEITGASSKEDLLKLDLTFNEDSYARQNFKKTIHETGYFSSVISWNRLDNKNKKVTVMEHARLGRFDDDEVYIGLVQPYEDNSVIISTLGSVAENLVQKVSILDLNLQLLYETLSHLDVNSPVKKRLNKCQKVLDEFNLVFKAMEYSDKFEFTTYAGNRGVILDINKLVSSYKDSLKE